MLESTQKLLQSVTYWPQVPLGPAEAHSLTPAGHNPIPEPHINSGVIDGKHPWSQHRATGRMLSIRAAWTATCRTETDSSSAVLCLTSPMSKKMKFRPTVPGEVSGAQVWDSGQNAGPGVHDLTVQALGELQPAYGHLPDVEKRWYRLLCCVLKLQPTSKGSSPHICNTFFNREARQHLLCSSGCQSKKHSG